MSWFEEQLKTRRRLDDEQVAEAHERIARSVLGTRHGSHATLDDVAATDSAVAALLRYFGKVPAEIPVMLTDVSERVDFAVRSCGMMKRRVRLEGQWWRDTMGAYLGQLHTGEPIAIIPLGLRSYCYVEPLTNRRVLLTARTAADVMPEAYCFYRPLPERRLSIRDFVRFMGTMLDLGDYVRIVLASLMVALVGMLPAVANELLFERVIPAGEMSLVLPIGALLVGTALSGTLIGILRSMVTARLSGKLSMQAEAATMARLLLLPTSFFKGYQPGDHPGRGSGVRRWGRSGRTRGSGGCSGLPRVRRRKASAGGARCDGAGGADRERGPPGRQGPRAGGPFHESFP